jgi:rubrerythrin
MVKNKNNPFISDRDKICSVSESNDEHRMDYLKSMVKNSEYVCSVCGRAASSEEAICAPESVRDRSSSDSSVNENAGNLGDFGLPDYEKACFINDYDSSLRMELLKSLAENAEFVCSACGRAASSENDVCSPEKL